MVDRERQGYNETELRPSKDEYFLRMAEVAAQRATCTRLSVGAVVVRDDMLISTGYNSAPKGLPHCTEVGCDMEDGHCIRAVHAELNSLLQAAFQGTSTRGGTMYVTHLPCKACTKAIINAGITRVVYRELYRNSSVEYATELFAQVNIDLVHLPGED